MTPLPDDIIRVIAISDGDDISAVGVEVSKDILTTVQSGPVE